MKKYLTVLVLLFVVSVTVSAQALGYPWSSSSVGSQSQRKASITFMNSSDCSMTLKVMNYDGGLYSTVTLQPHTSRVLTFARTSSYRLKIKAVHKGRPSYHDGGTFSVTCNKYKWTEGTMEFMMATYGSGLGPTISAKEYESNN